MSRYRGIAVAMGFLVATGALAAPPPDKAATSGATSYRINPGDAVDIYVWGEDKLARSLVVLPDGTFAFPLAGTVLAAGKTPKEVEAQLSKMLAPQFKDTPPEVTVSVRQPAGMQVSVIGRVGRVGTYTSGHYLTLLDVLALAGGPTDFADVGGIVVLRQNGLQTTVLHPKVNAVLKGKGSDAAFTSAAIELQSGDTIIVP